MSAEEASLLALCRTTMSEVLGDVSVDPESDFFEHGGDSLGAVRWMLELSASSGLSVELTEIYAAPSPLALARHLGRRLETSVTLVAEQGREYPVTEHQLLRLAAVQRSAEVGAAVPNSASKVLSRKYRVRGPLDLAALDRAFEAVSYRHDLLRAAFAPRDDTFTVRATPIGLRLQRVDASQFDDHLQAPFALDSGCLARVLVAATAPEDHVLGLAVDHIAADGISVGIILDDLATSYSAIVAGQDPALLSPTGMSGVLLRDHEEQLANSAAGAVSRAHYESVVGNGHAWRGLEAAGVGRADQLSGTTAVSGSTALPRRAMQGSPLLDECGGSVLAAAVVAVGTALYETLRPEDLVIYCVVSNRSHVLATTVGPLASVIPVAFPAPDHRGPDDVIPTAAVVRRALAASAYPFYRFAREQGASIYEQNGPIVVVNVMPRTIDQQPKLDGVELMELPTPSVDTPDPGIGFDLVYDQDDVMLDASCLAGFVSEAQMKTIVGRVAEQLSDQAAPTVNSYERALPQQCGVR